MTYTLICNYRGERQVVQVFDSRQIAMYYFGVFTHHARGGAVYQIIEGDINI